MKKIFALMIGEEVIEKSVSRNELVYKRNELMAAGKKAYVCVWVGRFRINGDSPLVEDFSEEVAND